LGKRTALQGPQMNNWRSGESKAGSLHMIKRNYATSYPTSTRESATSPSGWMCARRASLGSCSGAISGESLAQHKVWIGSRHVGVFSDTPRTCSIVRSPPFRGPTKNNPRTLHANKHPPGTPTGQHPNHRPRQNKIDDHPEDNHSVEGLPRR
jgi:hypothetical protein